MNPNADNLGDDSLSGPAAEALLAYMRRKEETGKCDVSEFVRDLPQYGPYEDVVRSHADAASLFGCQDNSSRKGPDTVSLDDVLGASRETIHAGDSPDLPQEFAYTTRIREIAWHAEGGLGVVCRGEDEILKREVAIKLIRPDREDNAAAREVFMLEAEITGRLDHPGVAPVHGIGETENGRRFYVMRFMPGESLAELIQDYHGNTTRTTGERVVMFRESLTRFASVCKTIAYAHTRGILHRDIKPHNVMLGRYGETIVIDWGLAIPIQPSREHRIEGETTLQPESGGSAENQGGFVGTLAYMPPEQAAGEPVLSPAADVYALGATLYHLICGRPPLQAETRANGVQKIIKGEYPRPGKVHEDVSPTLERICLKAMALKPEDRYTTAMALAQDVEQFLADEPVSVLPDNLPRQIARWGRHHPAAVQIGTVGLILLLLSVTAGSIASWVWYAEAVAAKETTLLQSAELAAMRWSTDLSLRWRILRHWADDPDLHQELRKLSAMDDTQAKEAVVVQRWLEARAAEDLGSIKVTSWYVNDAQGRLVARYPPIPRQLQLQGQRFDYRSYYHGGLNDLPPREAPYPPLAVPHLSAIYLSKGEQVFRVALSVPVRDADGIIGVLTMTINLGLLKDADLIDMRENNFGRTITPPLTGIYLNQITTQVKPQSLGRAATDVLHAMEEQDFTNATETHGFLIRDYSSPLDSPSAPPRQAAIAPVLVDGEWTGLVAVVEQPAD